MISLICGIKKKIQMNLKKTGKGTQTKRSNLWLQGKGWGIGERDWEFGINMYTPLYLK